MGLQEGTNHRHDNQDKAAQLEPGTCWRLRAILAAVPIIWSPLVYGPLYYMARNTNPPLSARDLLEPAVWVPLAIAGALGLVSSLFYWSPAVPAIVESITVLLTPVAMEGAADSGPFITFYMLVTFYWLAVGLTCFFVAKRIPQRSPFQKRFPGAFDAWDEDDD